LLWALSRAAVLLGDPAVARAADRLADGLMQHLWLPGPGLFAAGLSFPVAAAPDRKHAAPRPGPARLDTSCYAGWNALAASGLAACASATGSPERLATAGRIVASLERAPWLTDRGVRRSTGAGDGGPVFLQDQALLARAVLDLHTASADTAQPGRAKALVALMLRDFRTSSGAFRDRQPEPGVDHLPVVDRSVPAAAGAAVQVLIRLYRATGESRYLAAARSALDRLPGASLRQASRLGAMGRGLRAYLAARPPQQGT
jgi:uncharacterized protein YyaL (SSP411 family)